MIAGLEDTLIYWAGVVTAATVVGGAVVQAIRFLRRLIGIVERLAEQAETTSAANLAETVEHLLERVLALEQIGGFVLDHSIQTALWIIDQDGRCQYATRGFCRLVGASRDEVLDGGWLNFLAPESRSTVLGYLRAAAAEQRDDHLDSVEVINRLSQTRARVCLVASPLRRRSHSRELVVLATVVRG